jgi:hypothetical protein
MHARKKNKGVCAHDDCCVLTTVCLSWESAGGRGVCACASACGCEGRSVRYVVRGQRVTEQQARAHAAETGSVVCVVRELAGGGCGASVSADCACMFLQTFIKIYA